MPIPKRTKVPPQGSNINTKFTSGSVIPFELVQKSFNPSASDLVLEWVIPATSSKNLTALRNIYTNTVTTYVAGQIAEVSPADGYYLKSPMCMLDKVTIAVNGVSVNCDSYKSLSTHVLAQSYESDHLRTTSNWYFDDRDIPSLFNWTSNDTTATTKIQCVIPLQIVDSWFSQSEIYGVQSLRLELHMSQIVRFLFGIAIPDGLINSVALVPEHSAQPSELAGTYFTNVFLRLDETKTKRSNSVMTGMITRLTRGAGKIAVDGVPTEYPQSYNYSTRQVNAIGECVASDINPQLMLKGFDQHRIQITGETAIPAAGNYQGEELLFSTLDALDKIGDPRTGSGKSLRDSWARGPYTTDELYKMYVQLTDASLENVGRTPYGVRMSSLDFLITNQSSFRPGTTAFLLYDLEDEEGTGADLSTVHGEMTFDLVTPTHTYTSPSSGIACSRYTIQLFPVTVEVDNTTNTTRVFTRPGYKVE